MAYELGQSTVCSLISTPPKEDWSLVNVISPYVLGYQVMTINRGTMHCPGPRCNVISVETGEHLVQVWAESLHHFAEVGAKRPFLGWNWSPFSWGDIEMEKGGGQSLPLRWHMMVGAEDEERGTEATELLEWNELTPHQRRLMGENDYGELFGEAANERLSRIIPADSIARSHINFANPRIDGIGLLLPLKVPILELVGSGWLFREVIRPIGRMAEELLWQISYAMTTLHDQDLCLIMRRVEKGRWTDYDLVRLMNDPVMRSYDEAKVRFDRLCLNPQLLDALWQPVKARCERDTTLMDNWWRRGFAYSVAIHESAVGPALRVAFYVYVGACGALEAQGKLLKRPLNRAKTGAQILADSQVLWELDKRLKVKKMAV